MSHYEVHFPAQTKAGRDHQAWLETKRYLGRDGVFRLNKVRGMVSTLPRRQKVTYARMFCMMNGIAGRHPLRAVIRHFLGGKN